MRIPQSFLDELLEASQDENFAIALRDPNLTMDNNDALWQKVEAAIYSGYTRDDILAAGMVSAAEYDNVRRLARQLGYKPAGAPSSTGHNLSISPLMCGFLDMFNVPPSSNHMPLVDG